MIASYNGPITSLFLCSSICCTGKFILIHRYNLLQEFKCIFCRYIFNARNADLQLHDKEPMKYTDTLLLAFANSVLLERDSVSNHGRLYCLLNRLFRRRSKKTSKLRVTGLCGGNSPVAGEFPAQRASNAENVSMLVTSSWSKQGRWHTFRYAGCVWWITFRLLSTINDFSYSGFVLEMITFWNRQTFAVVNLHLA